MGRKLGDLYVKGTEVIFDDGEIDEETGQPFPPIAVWLQKLNPVQQDQAATRASAERARVLAIARLPEDHPEKRVFYDELAALAPTTNDMIEQLIAEDISKAVQSAEAEVAAREEWDEDGYLAGLQEAWELGARLEMHDPEHENHAEARRVYDELKKYADQVEEIVESERKRLQRDFAGKSDETLQKRCVDKLIRTHADRRWLMEYRKSELWLATRQPESKRDLYFESRADVDDLSIEVFAQLINEYSNLLVPPTEGKG
jgi:hypothetical protein